MTSDGVEDTAFLLKRYCNYFDITLLVEQMCLLHENPHCEKINEYQIITDALGTEFMPILKECVKYHYSDSVNAYEKMDIRLGVPAGTTKKLMEDNIIENEHFEYYMTFIKASGTMAEDWKEKLTEDVIIQKENQNTEVLLNSVTEVLEKKRTVKTGTQKIKKETFTPKSNNGEKDKRRKRRRRSKKLINFLYYFKRALMIVAVTILLLIIAYALFGQEIINMKK